jgi:hypothetical protein
MSITVFYAWQSDRDERTCHYLIRDAANDALEELKSAPVEEAPPIELILDHDRKGVPGQPHIAELIKAKIARCSVFVADLTHVGEYKTSDGRTKHAQNANVLIELGLALRYVPADRMIFVLNTAFGARAEDLPFDLKQYAYPIMYQLPPGAANAELRVTRRTLAGRLHEHLKSMIASISG